MKSSGRQDLRPSMQFYIQDWLSDPALRMCPPEARGVWIDMLCIMWLAPRRGTLSVINKVSKTEAEVKQTLSKVEAEDLARIVGMTEAELKQSLSTLEAHGVFSKLDDGTIYSRRMLREWKQSQSKQEAGRRGGRVSKPRSKTEAPRARARSSSPSSSTSKKKSICAFDTFWDLYPRKVGKQAARRAWAKITPGDKVTPRPVFVQTVLLPALRTQKEWPAWKKNNGEYIPHPATWLNGARWEDEPLIEPATKEEVNLAMLETRAWRYMADKGIPHSAAEEAKVIEIVATPEELQAWRKQQVYNEAQVKGEAQ